jgi:RNA polymerase sigma factor (sigma-70 family)
MAQSDAVLFDKWRNSKDADAFAELLSRHANMVYGACLRVVKNANTAEEVAQDCFMELMKGPGGVRSVGGWLHTVATRRALDRMKAEGRRSEREAAYAATADTTVEATWDDTREFVDEAIASLPEELRVPIVLRFLEARPQKDIAEELALSRSAVQRRIDKGVDLVRESLAERGVMCTAAALTTLFESLPAEAAPPGLLAELGKHALAMRPAQGVLTGLVTTKHALVGAALLMISLSIVWLTSRGGGLSIRQAASGNGVEIGLARVRAPLDQPPTSDTLSAVTNEIPIDVDANVSDGVELRDSGPEKMEDVWQLDLTPSEETQLALKSDTNVEFRDIHIKNVLEFVQDSFAINVAFDSRVIAPPSPHDPDEPASSRVYATDGKLRHVSQRGTRLEQLLAVITTPLNLTYKVRGKTIWVSTSRQITEDLTVPLPSAPFGRAEILEVLNTPVSIEFEHIHISGILEYLRESYKINIVTDSRVIMPEPKQGEEAPSTLSDHVTDGMIDYVCLNQTPLGETLFVVTRLLDLTYRVERNGVYISTPQLVKQHF